ncbi:MAG: efflux RND transporter periplasmic adaptor subunit [Anaerolineaceae bacterium]
MKTWLTKHKRLAIILSIVIVVVVGALIYFQIAAKNADVSSLYQTYTVEKTELTSMVGATGNVKANQSTRLAWSTTGRIETINVSLNQKVKAGDVLALLDKSTISQSILSAQSQLITAKQALKDLKESATAKAKAELTLAQAKIDYEDAIEERTRKDYKHVTDATLKELEANYILAKNGYDDAKDLYAYVEDQAIDSTTRAAGLLELSRAEKARDTALANLNYGLGLPDENEVAKAEANLNLAKAAVDDAQREWETVKDGPSDDDIAIAEANVAAAEATVKMMRLESPIGGTVTAINSMVGDEVSPTTASFQIDDLSRMVINIQLTEVDIRKVQVGQDVEVTFDGIPDKKYKGKVYEVGQVGTIESGTVSFLVRIELTDNGAEVLPGMTAATNIIVTYLKDVVTVPSRAVKTLEGKRVVYVLKENQPVPVDIEIGETSDTHAQLLGDTVKVGDIVVLNPPTPNMMFGPGSGGGEGGG